MSARSFRTPSYRLHKPSGQAVVTINGRDIYLGGFNTPESRSEYDRIIAEWLTNGRRPSSQIAQAGNDLTVNEMALAYLRYVDSDYTKSGKPTSEPKNIRLALRPLCRRSGHTPALEFGTLRLKTVRKAMIESVQSRNEADKRAGLTSGLSITLRETRQHGTRNHGPDRALWGGKKRSRRIVWLARRMQVSTSPRSDHARCGRKRSLMFTKKDRTEKEILPNRTGHDL